MARPLDRREFLGRVVCHSNNSLKLSTRVIRESCFGKVGADLTLKISSTNVKSCF